MKLKHLFTINAVISLLYGLGEVLTPAAMLTTYGFPTGPVEKLLAQYFGMALLGLGMLIWTMRNISDPKLRRGSMISLLLSNLVGVVLALTGTLGGIMSPSGWSSFAIHGLLTLGYMYFLVLKPLEA